MSLTTADFDYQLPPELIAQEPIVGARDQSRLLWFDKASGQVEHQAHFADLATLLAAKPGRYLIIRNDSAVIPARLIGHKPTGGQVELLLVKSESASRSGHQTWTCLTKPGLKPGQTVTFPSVTEPNFTATCLAITDYTRLIEFSPLTSDASAAGFTRWLAKVGATPLPPYIDQNHHSEDELRQLYQTTYAAHAGSVAAPTAGLHFTPQLDEKLRAQGIELATVTLHVGLGTFLTVKATQLDQHQMHAEQFTLTQTVANQINAFKASGGEIIAVGTTTTRVLESCFNPTTNQLEARQGETEIFIYPPRRFQVVDHLITNFHLPQSTLLMLISALTTLPNTDFPFTNFLDSPIGRAYQTAIDERYRFFSFGDAMMIW